LNGGKGLVDSLAPGTFERGWLYAESNVAPSDANLECDATLPVSFSTWTPTAGKQENLPINCTNWYEAYAFCIWDGGFLPSAAEREYAAAGGSEQREYPWGSQDPGTTNRYAIWGCYYPNGSGMCKGIASIAPVGTATLGVGRWGHLDLVGELDNPTLDQVNSYFDPCIDCASLTGPSGVVAAFGGEYSQPQLQLLVSNQLDDVQDNRSDAYGIRCARPP
jgi:formylglycine-generating enzyme required for sulfatase activity